MSMQDQLVQFFELYNQRFINAVNPSDRFHSNFIDFFSLSAELSTYENLDERLNFKEQIYYHRLVIGDFEKGIRQILYLTLGGLVTLPSLQKREEQARSSSYDELKACLTEEEFYGDKVYKYFVSCKEHYKSAAYNMLLQAIMEQGFLYGIDKEMDFETLKNTLKSIAEYYADQCVNYKPIKNVLNVFFSEYGC